MESEQDENKQVSGDQLLEGENGDDEHKRIHSEETASVIIHSETHSRSSSSSSSSSYSSPPKNLPEDDKESLSNDPEVSPTDSPPVQVMYRENNNNNGGDQGLVNYDPNRIPSSVFERSKSNIPAEWSCTSNESLFSIHLGRNSFTVDMMKSGELYKSGELLAYSHALPMPPPPGRESNARVFESKVVDSDKEEDEEVFVVVQETHKEEGDKRDSHDEREQHPAVSWKTPTTSYRSNRSLNSAHSFSFPVLAGAASDSANAETEEQKKQAKRSEETKKPAEAANKKHSTMCRRFSCFPPCPCPWCCSSCSCS